MAKKQKPKQHTFDPEITAENVGEIFNLELLDLMFDPEKDVEVKTDDGRLVIQVRDKK